MNQILIQTLTPEDVLNIFKEQHRLVSPLDPEADEFAVLSFDSTIDDWRSANDLLPWRPIGEFLNIEFNINATEYEWRNILTPASKRTLRDVCNFISKHSSFKDIYPVNLLGKECLSAAVFITLKKYLQRRKVDVKNLRPSNLIAPYLEIYFSEMIEQTTIISKGKQVFHSFEVKRKKTGFLNSINIFDDKRNSVTISSTNIRTFRDLVFKIIEIN